jgi:hypothetical protein
VAAAIAITPATVQAGITLATVSGTGFTANTVYSLETTSPHYGSNWTLPTATNETLARREVVVKADATGAFTYQTAFGYDLGQTFTFKARPISEQYLDTTAVTTATVVPTQNST